MQSLPGFGYGPDPTFDNIPTLIWSAIETSAAFVCACLPAIRAAGVRLFPKIWTTFANTYKRSNNIASVGRSRGNESAGRFRHNEALERSSSQPDEKTIPSGLALSSATNILASIDRVDEEDESLHGEFELVRTGSAGTLTFANEIDPPDTEKAFCPNSPRSTFNVRDTPPHPSPVF